MDCYSPNHPTFVKMKSFQTAWKNGKSKKKVLPFMVNLESPGSKNHRPGSFPPPKASYDPSCRCLLGEYSGLLGGPTFSTKKLGEAKKTWEHKSEAHRLDLLWPHGVMKLHLNIIFSRNIPSKFKGCRLDPSLEPYFSAQSRSALEKVSQANARCAPSATGKTWREQQNPWSMFLNFFEDPSLLLKGVSDPFVLKQQKVSQWAKQLILSFQKIRDL